MKIRINDKFWNERIKIVQNVMLPFQWRVLNDQEPGTPKSGAIMNFKIASGLEQGEFYGMVFQDTDLYKWIEAVAYSLELHQDSQLKKWADEAIDLISQAQMEDGYVDTYFQIFHPELKWTDLTDNHELYSHGHLIECGVAYYQATGNQKIYEVITKVGDMLVKRFGNGKLTTGLPGHPEIELALMRLYDLTKREEYLELAKYFVLTRGSQPNYFIEESKERRKKGIPSWLDISWNNGFVNPESNDDMSYYVASKKLIDQVVVEGHAVRACYLYSALADIAREEGNQQLVSVSKRLFDNATTKQMYITGGLGQTNRNEGFTRDYDLPNESNYCETCAGISLIYWAQRMLSLDGDSKYADVIEKSLYNNTLGSMSLDGKSFYYSNELERWGENVARASRPKWHACACCPPNLARLVLSLGKYVAHEEEDSKIVYIDQFIGANIESDNGSLVLKGEMPWDNSFVIKVNQFNPQFKLAIRLPEWSSSYKLTLNNRPLYEGVDFTINKGYIILLSVKENDEIVYLLDLQPKLVYANPLVKQNAGKAVISRGPLIYCLEEEDNGNHLWQLAISADNNLEEEKTSELGQIIRIKVDGTRDSSQQQALYSYTKPNYCSQIISAIPFYARYNRSVGELQVWTRVKY